MAQILKPVDGLDADDSELVKRSNIKKADLAIHAEYFKASADLTSTHDILLLRPFQTYTMHSAILAKGGSDLGNVYHGHHDFQLSDNVAVKTHLLYLLLEGSGQASRNYTLYLIALHRDTLVVRDTPSSSLLGSGGEPGDLGKAIQEGTW